MTKTMEPGDSCASALAYRRSVLGWTGLRVVLAALIGIHGWARLLAGAVVPFGAQLQEWGLPLGLGIAMGITAIETGGSLILAAGRCIALLTSLYAAIYAMGILLVHAPAGWFVVGLGRNGAEYSVLLIACLVCVGIQHPFRRGKARKATSPGAGPG